MEGRRPRQAYARGVKGQRGRCPSMFRHRYRNRNRHGGPRAPAGLCGAGHKGNEAVAPPCYGIGIEIEIFTEGRRPRQAYARGVKGQRGRCPSMLRYRHRNRNLHGGPPATAGLCGAGHKGNEAVAPPRLCR